jgi:hypothetical protein
MMMITHDLSQSPYYSHSPSMALSAPVVPALDIPCVSIPPPPPMRAVTPEPSPSKKQRRCRKVGFGMDRIALIESAIEFTQEECDDRWYRSTQIASFKEEAKQIVRKYDAKHNGTDASIPRHTIRNDEREVSPTTSANNNSQNKDTSENSTRGLDVYIPSRQRFCKKYIQHVLEAYHVRCVGNDEHVALLAEKWGKKSLMRAISVAKKDFVVAYLPEEVEQQ